MSIEIQQSISLGNFSLDTQLSLPGKGVSALFGPSGSGKSSLLRAIAGLDRHAGGSIIINGTIWQNAEHFEPVYKRSIGYVFQDSNLFPHLSVEANIAYASRRCATPAAKVSQLIELLGIGSLLSRKPAHLSGGEKQKVAITRALACNPQLLLMDEPLASVDRQFRDSFLPELKTLIHNLGVPVLYVSHAPDEVAQLADHLILLGHNCTPVSGEISTMLTNPQYSLFHRSDAEAVIEAQVSHYDAPYGLVSLQYSGGQLTVSSDKLPLGQHVRCRVFAQDVSVTLEPQQLSSILNSCPATIMAIHPFGNAQVTLLLQSGTTNLLARITRRSADLLNLICGMQVYAQIKSVAVLN